MTDPRTIKFQLMLAQSDADHIDDWMFARRIRSRAEAIRQLCRVATSLLDERDIIVRLTDELWPAIQNEADRHGRSMSAEIATLLEQKKSSPRERKNREKAFVDGVRVLMERYLEPENDSGYKIEDV
ncbi:hypothetical protein [Rhizobium sp. BK456]|uniref:hypothetical protein n=1 Tax=Rhizobium sp. BK456 TaxID=2587007 RepID=UPI00160871E7|nr:hypothetical protein [Rhizobium sp. BK456]MBB3521028.1 plasmid stability protein [Rhizobium sp. BK456]